MKLLDTDVCITFLNGRDRALARRLLEESEELVLCSVVKAELWFGAEASAAPARNHARLDAFFESFESLPFDDAVGREYGKLRARLRARGTPIGPNDLMIAATATANGLSLVTRNARGFTRVEGLEVEVW
ncbi:MAG: type II toxin-antitoxin system VapC family toxin [Myxococcota bacterium]